MEAWDGIGNDAAYNHAQTPRGASAHANSKDASKKPEAVEGVSGTALRFTDYDVVATRSAMTLRQHTFAAWVKGQRRQARDGTDNGIRNPARLRPDTDRVDFDRKMTIFKGKTEEQ